MLTYVVGNLFESPAQVLVNTVNTVGVMGKGIAKEFKTIFPDMFTQYQQLCEAGLFDVGQLWLYRTPHKWVLNFPTKKHWRHPSRIEYIEAGLQKFVSTYTQKGMTSIAFPMLGCGNGELDWDRQVRPLMERYLKNLMIDVYIYLYQKDHFVPEHRNPIEVKNWLRSEPGHLPFDEVIEDLLSVIGPRCLTSRVGDQMVTYFLILDSHGELGLKIQGDGWQEIIENEQLFVLWQQIKAVGFLSEDSIPKGMGSLSPFVMDLFGRLPYFRPVLLARTYRDLTTDSCALQLVTPTRSGSEAPRVIPQVEVTGERTPQEA